MMTGNELEGCKKYGLKNQYFAVFSIRSSFQKRIKRLFIPIGELSMWPLLNWNSCLGACKVHPQKTWSFCEWACVDVCMAVSNCISATWGGFVGYAKTFRGKMINVTIVTDFWTFCSPRYWCWQNFGLKALDIWSVDLLLGIRGEILVSGDLAIKWLITELKPLS